MLEFNTLTIQSQTSIHLLYIIEIDATFALPAAIISEVLEKKLTWKFSLLQSEPSAPPSLKQKDSQISNKFLFIHAS